LNKEVTKSLSIIASESEFDPIDKWVKFDSLCDLKDAYIICQSEIQAKIISEPIIPKNNSVNSTQQQIQLNNESQKKQQLSHPSKNH